MIAKLSHRRKIGRETFVTIECPSCRELSTVSYAGWSAIACPRCGEELQRYASRPTGRPIEPQVRITILREHFAALETAAGRSERTVREVVTSLVAEYAREIMRCETYLASEE
jgi:ribosomal protein S27E